MQKKSEKIILTLYLLGFLALALTIALLQPLANTPPLFGNPPDEHARSDPAVYLQIRQNPYGTGGRSADSGVWIFLCVV